MRTAIVYDRVNKWGGAERVLLALHEIFPEAPLYTSVYDSDGAPWAKVFPKVMTSFLQKFPFAKSNHEFFPFLMPLAFESFDFSEFDLVISVTSEAAKGIRTKPGTLHICYLLTPTRYLWSSRDFYFKNPPSKFGFIPFFASVSQPFIKYLKGWDICASQRPDRIIAISTEVKNRVKQYYKRKADIIFPPAGDTLNDSDLAKDTKRNYFLIVNRLIPYKKVDLAIRAFNKLKYPFYVVGSGSEEKRLKEIALDNIKFFGQVDDKKLKELYMGAKALIMPQDEDFGIVAVEAQGFGVPVIAYKKGGALDTVLPDKTGVFFEEQEPQSLINAVKKFEKMKFDDRDLKRNTKRFSKKIFQKNILALCRQD